MSYPEPPFPIHASLEPFARLLGEWEGMGSTYLCTDKSCLCTKNISIGHIGQPSFWYSSRAYAEQKFRHRDLGFLFFDDNTGLMKFMCCDNTGHVHIMSGTAKIEDGKIEITLDSELEDGYPLLGKPKMLKVRRTIYLIVDNTLTQKVFMATEKANDLRMHTDMIYKRLPTFSNSNGL